MFHAGKRNRLVQIQRPSLARDELGQPVTEWVDVARVWASILNKSGIEAIRADSQVSIVRTSIRIGYRTDVDATMRVLHGGVVYEVKATLPDEVRREYVDLVCETGASNG